MEGVIGLYKTECIRTTVFDDGPCQNVADAEYATASRVDWYNDRRLHSTLGYTSNRMPYTEKLTGSCSRRESHARHAPQRRTPEDVKQF
ncbi:transposase InsO family protein [Kineosphaera limosa]|uniref:Integrase catalytic domain-containing protein n=2 Tax=Kineosphaera TaxID=211469 RepID=K6W503_9MICO|nr:transposase InsO family protein [Kineosphaera limosa]GAB94240.1 hypothetical protein KILIM_004_00290 [Kineosphaera limosa NBRC 100340]